MNELPPGHPGTLETPFERVTTSDTLVSRLVDPEQPRRILGYDVAGDLQQNYSWAELLFLTLTSVLPDESTGRAFERSIMALSPIDASNAGANVAILASVVGADPATAISAAALACVEDARAVVEAHDALHAWLCTGLGPSPDEFRTDDEHVRKDVEIFADNLGIYRKSIPPESTWLAAALIALWAVGIQSKAQWLSVVTFARLPIAVAEGVSSQHTPGSYPNNIPRYRYVDAPR